MAKKMLSPGEKIAKTIKWRKKPLSKRVEARVRAMKIGRIRRRRRKRIARAERHLKLFENDLTKLESDHLAIKGFRERRIPNIEKRIAEIDSKLKVLFKQSKKHFDAKELEKAKKIWQKEHLLEERKRALRAELGLIKHLK